MKSIYRFIVETDNRYNNKVDVEGKELIINTEVTERDFMFTNRVGKVIATPIMIDTPIEEGDEIIVHHNVFRQYFDMKGNRKESSNYLMENQFQVQIDQIFAYKRKNEWVAMPGYCFVTPVLNEDMWSTDTHKKNVGTLVIMNDELESLGLTYGDEIGYQPDTDYEFNIDGEIMYRIKLNHITYGPKKETRVTDSCG